MPNWINKNTKQVLRSVAEADLPEDASNYIQDPTFNSIDGQPPKYWKIVSGKVLAMSEAERAEVDAAEAEANFNAAIAEEVDDSAAITRAVVRVVVSEINALREQAGLKPRTMDQVRTAIRSQLGS